MPLHCHFPQHNTIWSFGSGYGGNALLGKKCLALRIGSYLGRSEGWLAEHMLILGVEDPRRHQDPRGAAFLGLRQDELHDDLPGASPGGESSPWGRYRLVAGGRRAAVGGQPGEWLFRRRPRHQHEVEPQRHKTIAKNTIFTNVAVTKNGEVWWEGLTVVPEELTD